MPKLGQAAICKMCKKPIIFTGDYWKHTDYSPRHPATPMSDEEESHRIRQQIWNRVVKAIGELCEAYWNKEDCLPGLQELAEAYDAWLD